MIDDPRHLLWHGRANLYGQVGAYLTTSGEDERGAPITDFASWEQTATELRETGTRVASKPVWEAVDPLQSLTNERENPTRVFLLDPGLAGASAPGARQGPFGSILKDVRPVQRAAAAPIEPAAPRLSADESPTSVPPRGSEGPVGPAPIPVPTEVAGTSATEAEGAAPPSSTDPMDLPSMPPMVPAAAVAQSGSEPPPSSEAPGPRRDAPVARPEPAKTAAVVPASSATHPPATNFSDEDVIRSSEQFLTMFKRLGPQGGSLRIAAGADLELPTVVIAGMGPYQLLAEPGVLRPRIRFRPPQLPPASPTDWTVLLNLRSGSLRLQGLDILVPDQEMLRADRVAAAGLLPGTELTFADCTLTVAGRRSSSSVFVVQPLGEILDARSPEPQAPRGAIVQLRNSFLRSGGDGVAVASGRQLTLELANVLVGTEGSLVHAFGSLRRTSLDAPSIRVRLDQVTARVKGGLIHLDSTPDEPELTSVDIRAEDSIMSTAAGDDPLFRLEGQDQLDQLRDKIRWEGRKVAYHRIKTFRRDEIVQTGVQPRIYDRDDWTTAFLPKDESPMLGDVRFLREVDPSRAAWKLSREDLRLAPESPVARLGPDLGRIPAAPADSDL
jgi:hypothetical protein